MAPRGRPPSAKTLVDRQLGRNVVNPVIPAGDQFIIPNHSGDHAASLWRAGIDGSVVFFEDMKLAQDNSNLFWDTVNKRLGVGTASPSVKLEISPNTDDDGIKINGFDDRSGENYRVIMNSGGNATMTATKGMSLQSGTSTASDLALRAGSGKFVDIDVGNGLRIRDDLIATYGTGNDYSIGYVSADDTLKIVDGNNLGINVRMTIDSTGNVGIGTSSPSQPLSVKEKVSMTDIGGVAIKLTNKSGANSVAGNLVVADSANNDAVTTATAADVDVIGVFLEDSVSDGSEAWVVVAGIADVMMMDNAAATRGNWVAMSRTENAVAVNQASPAAAPQHFEEIGHCIESVAAGGAGTNIKARCVLHFN